LANKVLGVSTFVPNSLFIKPDRSDHLRVHQSRGCIVYRDIKACSCRFYAGVRKASRQHGIVPVDLFQSTTTVPVRLSQHICVSEGMRVHALAWNFSILSKDLLATLKRIFLERKKRAWWGLERILIVVSAHLAWDGTFFTLILSSGGRIEFC
jgi:hypothetical protein